MKTLNCTTAVFLLSISLISQVALASQDTVEQVSETVQALLGEHHLQGDKGCDKVTLKKIEGDVLKICVNRNFRDQKMPFCNYFSMKNEEVRQEGNEIFLKTKKDMSSDMYGLPSGVSISKAKIVLNEKGEIEELENYHRSHDLTFLYPIERLVGTTKTSCKAQ